MISETIPVADDHLRSFYDRWLRLEEEKQAISDDLKELFAEAKGNGFDTKAMRAVFRDMGKDSAERDESQAIYDLYWASLNKPRAGRAREELPTAKDVRGLLAPEGIQQGSAAVEAHSAHNRKVAGSTPAPATNSSGESRERQSPAPIQDSKPEAPLTGPEGSNAPAGTAASDFQPPAFLLKREHHVLRPHCMRPELCAGVGREHCYSCRKAIGESEAA